MKLGSAKLYDMADKVLYDKDIGSALDKINNVYNYKKQVADYLFETEYSSANIDYDFANAYFQGATAEELSDLYGYCTGVIKDSKVLRHFDYFYNNTVEFIVHRPADPEAGVYGSLAVAGGFRDLTKSLVESNCYSEKYKLVPFATADGINDQGLYIQQNVVPKTCTYNINPDKTTKLCINMVPRYILDYCSSFDDIETKLSEVNIYGNPALDFGIHFLVAKGTDWRIIEFTADDFIIVGPTSSGCTNTMPNGIITNFRTTGLSFTGNTVDWNSIEEYGIGVERFDTATKVFTEGKTLESLRTELQYSKLYTDSALTWKTEECGTEGLVTGHKLTVMNAKNNEYTDDFNAIFTKEKNDGNIKTRQNGNGVWQTVHSCIYDLSAKKLNIAIQERFTETFNFYLKDLNR